MRRRFSNQIMPNEARLMLEVAGGHERALPIIFSIVKMGFMRTGDVFRHMVRRGIVGKLFIEFAERNEYVPWRMYKAMTDEMDGHMKRPLIAHLDT